MYTAPCTFAEMLPPHSVDRPEVLATLTDAMSADGWQGRPLLGWYDDDTGAVYLLTGSHRYSAARAAGLENSDGDEGLDVALVEVTAGRFTVNLRGELCLDGYRLVDFNTDGELGGLLREEDSEALALLEQEPRE